MLNMTEYVKMTFKTLTSLYEKLLELHKEKQWNDLLSQGTLTFRIA